MNRDHLLRRQFFRPFGILLVIISNVDIYSVVEYARVMSIFLRISPIKFFPLRSNNFMGEIRVKSIDTVQTAEVVLGLNPIGFDPYIVLRLLCVILGYQLL